jgi:glycosyltransferase involved in cell wall biosynthesis
VTIHDAAYVRFPEFRNIFSSIYIRVSIFLTRFFRRRVCTVSEFSKQELISLYKFCPDDITVTVNGLPKINPATNAAVPGGVRKPYFLYIGVIRPRKNIERLLRAFAARDLKIKNYQLVLAGGVDDTFLNVSNLVESLGLSGQVLQTGFVSEAEKAGLMKEASALVFPSLYEGFGLPVLEAQSFGLPVLTSRGSSLVEVSGGGALFCDPESIGDIAGKLASIALDVNLRERLIDGGYKNLERFSWQRTARKLMTLFQSVSH